MFLELLRDSLSNQASCVRAGMLDFLLDWFSQENCESIIWKISPLIQVIGGHSISGKDIRKIFALLRSERAGRQHTSSLLLTSMLTMLNEKGPTAFFDLNGVDSVSPVILPHYNPSSGFHVNPGVIVLIEAHLVFLCKRGNCARAHTHTYQTEASKYMIVMRTLSYEVT